MYVFIVCLDSSWIWWWVLWMRIRVIFFFFADIVEVGTVWETNDDGVLFKWIVVYLCGCYISRLSAFMCVCVWATLAGEFAINGISFRFHFSFCKLDFFSVILQLFLNWFSWICRLLLQVFQIYCTFYKRKAKLNTISFIDGWHNHEFLK